jgi:hypothetical protein
LPTKISIAIPASVASDTPHLREKTAKIGLIGRAAAIFRINEIIVYPDNPKAHQTADGELVAMLLSYIETPQYLRKALFKIQPELQYAGILPPLRTPHHPLNRRAKLLKVGEYREGVTVSQNGTGTLVDIGVERPAVIADTQLSMNKRVTVRILKIDTQVEVGLANREEKPEYWGYRVTLERRPLGKIVKDRGFNLTIATSKYGKPYRDVAKDLTEKWKTADTAAVAFGPPTQGLHEIARHEGLELDRIMDFVVNMIPNQGTQTVRTEEALVASLAILSTASL